MVGLSSMIFLSQPFFSIITPCKCSSSHKWMIYSHSDKGAHVPTYGGLVLHGYTVSLSFLNLNCIPKYLFIVISPIFFPYLMKDPIEIHHFSQNPMEIHHFFPWLLCHSSEIPRSKTFRLVSEGLAVSLPRLSFATKVPCPACACSAWVERQTRGARHSRHGNLT